MNRKFGVELELIPIIPHRAIQDAAASVLETVTFVNGWCNTAGRNRAWDLKTDSSVTGGPHEWSENGWELASPVMKGEVGISRVVALVKSVAGAVSSRRRRSLVDQTCGFHVHMDVKDLSIKQMLRLLTIYLKAQPLIYQMVKRGRLTGAHSPPIRVRVQDWERRLNWRSGGKVKLEDRMKKFCFQNPMRAKQIGLSMRYYSSRGTVEFRMHEGSMDHKMVEAWIRFLMALVKLAKRKPVSTEAREWTPRRLFSVLGWSRRSATSAEKEAKGILECKMSENTMGTYHHEQYFRSPNLEL